MVTLPPQPFFDPPAPATHRDGDYVVEWVQTLPDLAEHLCNQVLAAASPRGLIPTHARTLAIRATLRADRYPTDGDQVEDRVQDQAPVPLLGPAPAPAGAPRRREQRRQQRPLPVGHRRTGVEVPPQGTITTPAMSRA